MAGKADIKVNAAAVGELLKSGAVMAMLRAEAENIAARAGPGFEVDSRTGSTRARASVFTATPAARVAEAKDRRLTRAFGG